MAAKEELSNQIELIITFIIEKAVLFIEKFFEFYNSIGDKVYLFYLNYSRDILNFMHVTSDAIFKTLLYFTALLASFYLFMSIVVLFKKKSKKYTIVEGKEPFVTIQIPTYNELAALNCAKRALDFDYPKNKYEIIIGDDSNDPAISKKIDEFASQHKELVKVTRRGENIGFKPGNLNHMLKYTNGEYLVIFDSDFLPEKNFLKSIIAPFTRDKDLSVVQARWNIENYSQNIFTVVGGSISLLCHNVALPFMTWFKGSSFLCGSAEAVKVKDLKEEGGWQAGALTEDIECSLRFMKKGKKLIYLDYLECKCEAPQTFSDLYKQQMRWAYGVITALKIHFFDIYRSKLTSKADKISMVIFVSGYTFTVLLFMITFFGLLSILTNEPAPIDWPRFLKETVFNVAITSGFLFSNIIALYLGKKLKELPRMVIGAFTVGLVVTYNVNIGIAKAIFNRRMQWFMLKKNGNELE